MAKRFIDTELFEDPWFMDLSKDAKLLWIYCITNCNHAGIIKINKKLIQYKTGIKTFETVSKDLTNSLIKLSDDKWFIPKFFKYQYPNYPEKTFRAADSAVDELRKYNLWDEKNNCILNTYLSVSKDLAKSASNSNGKGNGNSINKRKEIFKKEIALLVEFPADMRNEFIDYWTEPNKSKTKMRFEMQTTWDSKLRLKTWQRNNKEFITKEKTVFPDTPNYTFERTLQGHELTAYWRHLRKLGYKKVGERWELKQNK